MKKVYTLIALIGLAVGAQAQAVEPANLLRANPGGGDFNTASTWAQLRLPQDGDSVVIPAGVNVTFGSTTGTHRVVHYNNMKIDIFGTLTINKSATAGSATRNRLYLNYTTALASQTSVRLYNSAATIVIGAASNLGVGRMILLVGVSSWDPITGLPIGSVTNRYLFKSDDPLTTIVGPAQANQTTTAPTGTVQQGFSSGATTLPAVLVSFDAVKQGNSVAISWKTQQEQNTKVFVIEKSSNGVDYRAIGSVPAAGNSSIPLSYSYADASSSAMAYYRVRIVDQDGRSATTGVKAIRGAAAAAKVGVYPNPAVGVANVVIDNPEQQSFSMNVFNRNGQLMAQQRASAGTNFVRLDLTRFAAGDYMIDVQFANGSRQNSKMIVAQH